MALQSAVILLGILLALPHSARSVDTGRRHARPPQSPSSVESKNCTEISHVFEGPYWVDENIETSNVRLNVSYGVPLNITFKLVNGTLSEQLGACAGIENARIDLWQCRYDGLYSDEVAQSTEGETWLRGYQFTNSTGHASFQTIYPATKNIVEGVKSRKFGEELKEDQGHICLLKMMLPRKYRMSCGT